MNTFDLVCAAKNAREKSYSPYSHFKVGAAALGSNGEIYSGVNIENSSFGLTMCAERVAIFAAITGGSKRIEALAISCEPISGSSTKAATKSLMPCGACRQVMAEFSSPTSIVLVDRVGEFSLQELLPQAFSFPRS